VGWAAASAAAVHDPYANALRLQLAGDAASAARLRAELAQTAQHDRDGAHWTQAGYSPFYGWGHAGELETTALVLGALRQDDASTEDRALANDALFYLLGNQDRYGIWESGQATVRVLHAMLPIAIEQMKAKGSSQEFRLAVNGVALTGNDAEALRADPTLIDAPRSLDLTALLKPGHNELVFSSASQVALASAEASASYYIPWAETATPAQAKTQTGKDYGLDFGYSCATANARVSQPIDCTVNARRFGSGGYGMLLAEVGLPPGADVDRASLVKLLDSWTISRYELQPDRIVFYLWSWTLTAMRIRFVFCLSCLDAGPGLPARGQPCPAACRAGQPAATLKIQAREVVLPVTVRDKKGALVTSLKISDFTLTEDGRPQTIKSFTRESNLPFRLGLLVDTSRSVSGAMENERKAAGKFVDHAAGEAQAGRGGPGLPHPLRPRGRAAGGLHHLARQAAPRAGRDGADARPRRTTRRARRPAGRWGGARPGSRHQGRRHAALRRDLSGLR
jgi:hypothetical protein